MLNNYKLEGRAIPEYIKIKEKELNKLSKEITLSIKDKEYSKEEIKELRRNVKFQKELIKGEKIKYKKDNKKQKEEKQMLPKIVLDLKKV